jgi:hypothetical protein
LTVHTKLHNILQSLYKRIILILRDYVVYLLEIEATKQQVITASITLRANLFPPKEIDEIINKLLD